MRIGIDVDGVIQDIERFTIDYGTKYCYDNNIDFKIDENKYYDTELLGISQENAEKFWNRYLVNYVKEYEPRAFAKEVIDILKNDNEIYIITSRDEYGMPKEEYGHMQELTKKWFKKNNIYYDKLIFSPDNKVQICKENNIDIMIEDWDKNIRELSEADINVFCFDNSYNRKNVDPSIERVYSWYDVLNKINNMKI